MFEDHTKEVLESLGNPAWTISPIQRLTTDDPRVQRIARALAEAAGFVASPDAVVVRKTYRERALEFPNSTSGDCLTFAFAEFIIGVLNGTIPERQG